MNRTFKQTTLLISCLTLFSSLVCFANHDFQVNEISATDNDRLTSSCSVLFPAIDDSDMEQLFLINEDDEGNKIYSGYYGDLFSSISQTASININYIVPKDAEETGEMISDFLLHGSENKYNIDISPNISSSFYNDSEKYKVDFVDSPDLRSPVHLYTRSDEKTISEFDYSTYYGKTVGITYVYKQATSSYEPTSRDSYFFSWAAINGLYDELNPDDSPLKIKKYYSEEGRNLALQNGDIDIIVEKHSLPLEDVRTLVQIGEINSYVGCASGLTDLYQKLDSAMKKLEADSSEYFSTLCDKWHPTNYKYVILNDTEKELIANKKLNGGFTIGYPKTVFPFIMEKDNESPYGVLPDYLSYCEDYLDVDMKLVQHSDAEEAIQDLKDGKIDFWFARNANHSPDEFLDTETYLNVDERFIVNRNNLLTFEEAKKIGCYSFDGVGTEFEDRLTNYKDYEQMFKDLNEGLLDGIITSLGLYNYAKYTLRFDNLINQASVGKTNLVFFSSSDAVVAHGILNKCIFALSNDGVDQILLEKYELQIDFHYTTGDFLQQNAIILIISATILIISLSLLLFIFLFKNSKIRKYNSELERLNSTDYMTGLLNKRMFNERSSDYINRQVPFSILMIDLNDFKSVNDTFSHVAGDEVIIEMGKRLKTLKGVDNWVYRFGGDEFLVFSNFVDKDKLSKLARDIIGLCYDDIHITGGSSIHISLSVGISSYPEDSQNIEELIINSDSALYDLKEKRVIGYGFFEKDKYYLNVKMNKIKIDLDQAIEDKRIYMVFQPVVETKNSKVIGFEALMRIKDFKYGPDEFIPVAEKTGVIDNLGLIALKEAIKFLHTLKKEGYPTIKVSVNFSTRQLDTTVYESIVKELADKYRIDITNIVAEITESLLLDEGEKTKYNIESIKKNNIDLALDDFGCGYSSIRALSRVNFNVVKFDKELIDSLSYDKKGLKNLIDFVHGYGCQVVAEGVETKDQVDTLKDLGAEFIQGYYFGRPMIKEAAIEYLDKNSK